MVRVQAQKEETGGRGEEKTERRVGRLRVWEGEAEESEWGD